MTDEHIILTESAVQKVRPPHRVPPQERFVISKLKKVRGLPWNGRAENLKATIVMQQDQGPSGHRRVCSATKAVAWCGATLGCSGCVGLGPHTAQKDVECVWKKASADDRACAGPVGVGVGPIAEPDTEPQQPAPAAGASVIIIQSCWCRHKAFRTSSWIHRWRWERKNAESARERGHARRHQVKSLKD